VDRTIRKLLNTTSGKFESWLTKIRSGTKTQTYDEHLGPVNSVVFVDNNKKFVSTSDDKKVFLWEFGIPVVVKHVSDPEQLAISQTALHPNGKYFVGQASDNKVFIFLQDIIFLDQLL
jgi:pre-mRNA-processing factor 17